MGYFLGLIARGSLKIFKIFETFSIVRGINLKITLQMPLYQNLDFKIICNRPGDYKKGGVVILDSKM